MNLDIIGQLVKIMKDAPELGAIEVRRGLFGIWSSVRVSKAGHPSAGQPVVITTGGAPSAGAHPSPAAPGGVPAPPAAVSPLVDIKSPMVGTFYKAPEPAAEPYAKMGTRVAPGQVVCIIEAMKIMNEIESEVQGVVREVCVENAQPVEFGQVLFRVDPHA